MAIELITKDDLSTLASALERMATILGSPELYIAGKKTLTINDIAKIEGISSDSIKLAKFRYLLPSFGVSEYPSGFARWNKDTYIKWAMIPAHDRKHIWDNMSFKDRNINRPYSKSI